MLVRILPFTTFAISLLAACNRSDDSSLVGSWRGRAIDTDGLLEMAGEVQFASDHTFKEREWDATNRLSGSGEWHVRGGKLVLNFRRAFDPQRPMQIESFLTIGITLLCDKLTERNLRSNA